MRKLWLVLLFMIVGIWPSHAITVQEIVEDPVHYQSIEGVAGDHLYWNSYAVGSVLYNPPMYGVSTVVYKVQYFKNTVTEEKVTFYYNLITKDQIAYAVTERLVYDAKGKALRTEGEEQVRIASIGEPMFTVGDMAFKKIYGSLYSQL